MTAWRVDDWPDVDTNDYFHVPAKPPRIVLGEWINEYRSLRYLSTPDGVQFNDGMFDDHGRTPPKHWDEREGRQYRAEYDVYVAIQGLKDIHLQCGWDVTAIEQLKFRRAEYFDKRAKYWEDVVMPLKQKADRIGNQRVEEMIVENNLRMASLTDNA